MQCTTNISIYIQHEISFNATFSDKILSIDHIINFVKVKMFIAIIITSMYPMKLTRFLNSLTYNHV